MDIENQNKMFRNAEKVGWMFVIMVGEGITEITNDLKYRFWRNLVLIALLIMLLPLMTGLIKIDVSVELIRILVGSWLGVFVTYIGYWRIKLYSMN